MHPARRAPLPGLAAQVEFESKIRKQIIVFEFQALSSRCFQLGSHRFNVHRLTQVHHGCGAAARRAVLGGGGGGQRVLQRRASPVLRRCVTAQVEFESSFKAKSKSYVSYFSFKALSSRRFQLGGQPAPPYRARRRHRRRGHGVEPGRRRQMLRHDPSALRQHWRLRRLVHRTRRWVVPPVGSSRGVRGVLEGYQRGIRGVSEGY